MLEIRYLETSCNYAVLYETSWNYAILSETSWNDAILSETSWNDAILSEISWNDATLRQVGTTPSYLRQVGTTLSCLRQVSYIVLCVPESPEIPHTFPVLLHSSPAQYRKWNRIFLQTSSLHAVKSLRVCLTWRQRLLLLLLRFFIVVVFFLLFKTPWPESASELYRPSDRHLSANLVPTFADRWCHVVSATNS
jgi:hypothetical protein